MRKKWPRSFRVLCWERALFSPQRLIVGTWVSVCVCVCLWVAGLLFQTHLWLGSSPRASSSHSCRVHYHSSDWLREKILLSPNVTHTHTHTPSLRCARQMKVETNSDETITDLYCTHTQTRSSWWGETASLVGSRSKCSLINYFLVANSLPPD